MVVRGNAEAIIVFKVSSEVILCNFIKKSIDSEVFLVPYIAVVKQYNTVRMHMFVPSKIVFANMFIFVSAINM